MPVMAPLLPEVGVAALARRMRPRQVIPVHDGSGKDFFVSQRSANDDRVVTAMNIPVHTRADPGQGVTVCGESPAAQGERSTKRSFVVLLHPLSPRSDRHLLKPLERLPPPEAQPTPPTRVSPSPTS